jgi:ABC-type Na+ efflux pump permease subunit
VADPVSTKVPLVDGAAVAATVSSPLWMQHFEIWAQFVLTVGGLILLTVRLTIAVVELYRRGWKGGWRGFVRSLARAVIHGVE